MKKLNKEDKKKLLVENFEVLKDNLQKNDESLGMIINNMISLGEIDLAFEMIKYILVRNPSSCYGCDFYSLCGSNDDKIKIKLADFLMDNDIRKALISRIKDSDYPYLDYVGTVYFLLSRGHYEKALNIVSFAVDNLSQEGGYSLINGIVQDYSEMEIPEQAVEILLSLLDRFRSKEMKSKLTTLLINYL